MQDHKARKKVKNDKNEKRIKIAVQKKKFIKMKEKKKQGIEINQ